MLSSTSCRNPLCPIPHKVFRTHAAYTRHLNSSTGCLHYIRTGTSVFAKPPVTPPGIVVSTSAQTPAFLRPHFVNLDHSFAMLLQESNGDATPLGIFPNEHQGTDDDFQCLGANDNDSADAEPELQPCVDQNKLPQSFAYPGFMHTIDQKWTAALLKVMDDINAPDYAFGLILAWARGASAEEYSFHPQGGLDRARNVTVLVKSMANATQLLPSVLAVPCPHGPPSDVVVFDFVPQLLRLLQNPSIMIPENVVLDFKDPLKPYTNALLGEALSGSVYRKAYARLITDPTRQLLMPIIQWIDRTSVTGNDRFSLKPYMFTPAIFTESFRRTIQAWGYHGYLPKSKTSTAQNQTQLQGDNIRNYHAQLSQVLHSFRTSPPRLRGITLPMGSSGRITVDIIPCILFVIQDMQEGDMLCGRFGPHTQQIQRQSRSCNVNYKDLASHTVTCKYLYAAPMHQIAQSNNPAVRQRWSQHKLDNAFQHVEMADPERGIFGATPVETLHAFRKGLVEMVTYVVLDHVPASKKAALDRLALRFHKSHRQTFRSTFPSTSFCNGITNITKLSAAERLGLVFLFVILGHYDEGWTILSSALEHCHNSTTETSEPAPKRHCYKPQFKDILQVFEAILCFDEWLRKDTYWVHQDSPIHKAVVTRSIAKLMHLSKKYIPIVKSTAWHYPKFHELKHIVDDIIRFGAPQNYCAQRPEALLIVAAKQPGRRAQKRHEGVVYELQAAQRLCYSLMINTVHDRIQQYAPSLNRKPIATSEANLDDTIHESTQGATSGILTKVIDESINLLPVYKIHWKSRTDVKLLRMDIELVNYLCDNFGDTVKFCTEYKRDIYTFRCHPSYGSAGPIYDWMIIQYDTGLFPSRLAAVVLDQCNPSEPIKLVVQSTTSRTSVKSTLFQEWNWSPDYITVLPSTIEAPCFVISIREDTSRVLETLARDKWADQFTSTE